MSQNRVLYWGSGSAPCWRALIALEEKGLEFESKLIEFSKQEHKSPEVLAINPRGKVPAFKDGDVIVNESIAICLYLENTYPEKPLLPADPEGKAKTYQCIFELNSLQDAVAPYYMAKAWGKPLDNEEEAIAKIKEELKLWDSYLSKHKYIATDEFTLADVVGAPNLLSIERYGATFAEYPNIKRYGEMIKEHPSIKKTWPPHWKTTPPIQNFMNIF